jgi:hypothetical protein
MQQFGCQTGGLASLVFLFVPQDGIETALACERTAGEGIR